ncbi:MAG: dockerin type I repeat-containing protein, partial [Planctomycetota bacterium]
GDFDSDGDIDADDIDLLLANLGDPTFDLTGDDQAAADDLDRLVVGLLGTTLGDANLDGVVDTSDLAILAGRFDRPATGWVQADFNGDRAVTTADLAILAGGFGSGVPPVATSALVPEPGVAAAVMVTAFGTIGRRRQSS